MNVYLAGSWSSQSELRIVRDQLEASHFKVTSRWLDKEGWPAPDSDDYARAQGVSALHDLADMARADLVIVDLTKPSTQGGRYFEMGYAYASGKQLLFVGEPTCHFERGVGAAHYPDWPAAYRALGVA